MGKGNAAARARRIERRRLRREADRVWRESLFVGPPTEVECRALTDRFMMKLVSNSMYGKFPKALPSAVTSEGRDPRRMERRRMRR